MFEIWLTVCLEMMRREDQYVKYNMIKGPAQSCKTETDHISKTHLSNLFNQEMV